VGVDPVAASILPAHQSLLVNFPCHESDPRLCHCPCAACRLVTNLIIGSACMLGFLVFRRFMKQYQLRSVSPAGGGGGESSDGGSSSAVSWQSRVLGAAVGGCTP
jgi:hypothetical protein